MDGQEPLDKREDGDFSPGKEQEIALFPLRSVIFPGGRIALQIFEQRYIDLVRKSMREDSGFGICFLKSGEETVRAGSQQSVHRTGTYVRIIDWDQLDNGLLGITVEGRCKFTVADCWEGEDGLLMATANFSATEFSNAEPIALADDCEGLVELLRSLERHPLIEQMQLKVDYENAWDLGWRLGELIPVSLELKQEILEIDDPFDRLTVIEELVVDLIEAS